MGKLNILNGRIEPLIIVHPYWLLEVYNLSFEQYDKTDPAEFVQENKLMGTSFGKNYYSYLENLEETIPNYLGPLITLETWRCSDYTKERYEYLGRNNNSYFIETTDMTPIPKEGWVKLFDLLDNLGAKKILLAGGSYSRHLKNPGCLGLTEEVLLHYNYKPTVVEGLHYLLDWKWTGDKVELLQKR